MLLVAAGSTQALLLSDLLLRRVLFMLLPSRRVPLQRYADNAVLSSFFTLVLQTATVPLQAATSMLGTVSRFWAVIVFCCVLFAALLSMSSGSIYAYTVLARMYNVGVAPTVTAAQFLFVLLDFVFRTFTPLWNGFVFVGGEILRRVVLPYSFHNVGSLPEILQGLTLMLASLGSSTVSFLENMLECTVGYESAARVCGGAVSEAKSDCAAMFTPVYTQCFAGANHLSLDLLTPGLFARQAALAVRRLVSAQCGAAAVVLNLLLFPLTELHLYQAVHASVNSVLFGLLGMPVTTVRRCEEARRQLANRHILAAQQAVACTPDWQPLLALMTTALESAGEVFNAWLNTAALLVREKLGMDGHEGNRCEEAVRMSSIVLDAARAIEGLESVDALERLQGRGGLPDSETLLRVRVVGVTPRLFGVTDGNAVLYRGAHDGYVWAYGAWPFAVDVRLGLASVSYSGSAAETDSSGDARTGLLGCVCVDEPAFTLLCATAPYVQHIDNDAAARNVSDVHTVSFPGLSVVGMTCARTAVRVLPLRWPRRRLASAAADKYERFSYANVGRRLQGDVDATESVQMLERQLRASPAGAVEAAIFVQPLCGEGTSLPCALEAANCFPWCMGVVRGGVRAQNISMFSASRWETHVLLPDVDCGVRRDSAVRESGQCNVMEDEQTIVDLTSRAGVVHAQCPPASMCTPAPVPAVVSSLVALAALNASQDTEMSLVREHKRAHWLGVRLEQQPFVVAGDVMLSIDAQSRVVVVTRLYDVGHGSLQMTHERLTMSSNYHAIEIAECNTQADIQCLRDAMQAGKLVLPRAFYQVQDGPRTPHADGGEFAGVLPAAASRWAVHWAANPALEVYTAVFDFCSGRAAFDLLVHSSFGPALVWTAHTMRSVDIESNGVPSAEEVASRVSYMRVPAFFGDFFLQQSTAEKYCSVVVGLKIVGVEYINRENILVTVLAARPRDYDPGTGMVHGPRTYRYYFLHPSRHDCVEDGDASQKIFTCWRSQETGMWPDDSMLGSGNSAWDSTHAPCVEARLVPAFGTAFVMPIIALLRVLETAVDALCTLLAVVVSNPQNPSLALAELNTLPIEKATFHSMVDSAGGRLLNVEDILSAVTWCTRFQAHLLIHALNAFSAAVAGKHKLVDKVLGGLRTIVVGAAKVREGGGTDIPEFAKIEDMFEQPIVFSSVHASTAILRMSDGLQKSMRLPMFVSVFMRTQASLTGSLALILRLGRATVLRLLQAGAQAPAAAAAAALLESVSVVEHDFLDVMRFQCYGLVQIVGASRAWGQALQHGCLLFPDTLEGVLKVVTVLTLEYPTVSCACKLGDGDVLGASALDTVQRICLLRPLPIEETQWLTAMTLAESDRRGMCFVTMDRANARLRTAFDKMLYRMYLMTQHVANVADALLSLITGDSVACDAFDISPYVMSIIPEPVDYFSACVDTADCKIRCLEEFEAFEAAKGDIIASGVLLGFKAQIPVTLESMFFSREDVETGRHKPPFLIMDVVDVNKAACRRVCGGLASADNRCVAVAGLRSEAVALLKTQQVAIAYYCLPLDVSQFVFQWHAMEVDSLPHAGMPGGFPPLPGTLVSLHIATNWGAQQTLRDCVVAVVHVADTSMDAQLLPEPVTQVLLMSPSRSQPLLLLRTSLRSERQLDIDVDLPAGAGFMHKIEHVHVELAEHEDSSFVVQARGYMMQRARIQQSEQLMWQLPQKVCVRCEVRTHILSGESSQVLCTKQCVGSDGEVDAARDAGSEFEFASANRQVCLRDAAAPLTSSNTDVCTESLWLPRTVANTNLGLAAQATLRLRVVDNGNWCIKDLRVPASVVELLQADTVQRAYRDMENQVQVKMALVSRVHYTTGGQLEQLRALCSGQQKTMLFEIITANARNVHGGWLHVFMLKLASSEAAAALVQSMRAEASAAVLMQCTVHTCGACAHSLAGHDADGELMQLENTCYAAKQCGVERCAGTLVNMRKPLCNLGKVLTSELHGVRVLLQALWLMLTDTICSVVELTFSRRESYSIRWPSRAMQQTTCTAKDSIVSLAATLTSLLGAVSHIMVDVSTNNEQAAKIDTRAHARFVMVLAATTNMLSAVMLWPVYQVIVLQKLLACTVTDVSYTLMRVVGAAGGSAQPQLDIKFNDGMDDAAQKAGVAMCLTEDVRQSLEDAGAAITDAGGTMTSDTSSAGLGKGGKIVRIIADAISGTIDTVLAAKVQYVYHIADIWLTWASGVIKGLMDIAQTVDWERCKLPVVDTGMRALGGCACNDKPYSIPSKQRTSTWTESAFWCSGLLMLNEGDGSDRIVWNPFSLEELLLLPGERHEKAKNEIVQKLLANHPHAKDYDLYVLCLREANSACEYFKPQHSRLARQGVEVMQVISRCRENYKQARWDEASVLYALFTPQEWRQAKQLEYQPSARLDDSLSQLRKRVLSVIRRDRGEWTALQGGFTPAAWSCLSDALNVGLLRHDCQRSVASFAYTSADLSVPSNTDACRVASASTARFPRMLWSGSSNNHVPIARLHPIVTEPAQRVENARVKIANMINAEVKPLFAELLDADFGNALRQHLDVNAFSSEGDQLHQFVDCVVLGPFAAADLSANVHLHNGPSLPVPQYHRGNAASREFTSWGETGGSEARKALIKHVVQHVDEKAQDILVKSALEHVRSLADRWLNIGNYLCTCRQGPASMSCCAYSRRQDISFGLTLSGETWDISINVLQDAFAHVAQSGILQTLWLHKLGEPVPLSEEHISQTVAAHLFAAASSVPVSTYGRENALRVLNDQSLWEWCTSRVSGFYASMPLTSEATNTFDGRADDRSMPHVPPADFAYDPASDTDDAPSREHSSARQHSMELLVDKLLLRSRELAPHFWTHVHRYVASDSVWCEQPAAPEKTPKRSFTPAQVKSQTLRQEQVLAPDMAELLYPAQVLQRCACGWQNSAGCFVPPVVCERGARVLSDNTEWARVCQQHSSLEHRVLVLKVLAHVEADALVNCSARELSTAWGLMAPHEYDAWYSGASRSWEMSAQHLATAGPGGLRLGMLSSNAPLSMQEHVRGYDMGERMQGLFNEEYKHTIAQPVCNSTLQALLREDLDKYFVDTLLPMAHSVQIVPAVEYCARWVLEYAMQAVLARAGAVSSQEMRVLIERQQMVADEWKERCSAQMLDMSICSLRGVYDIAPPSALQAPETCAVATQSVTGCARHFYTSGCILFCDNVFYDPCLCESQAPVCAPEPFSPSTCVAGMLVDARSILAGEQDILTSSMHWPLSVPLAETLDESQWDAAQQQLQLVLMYAKIDTLQLGHVFENVKTELLRRADVESMPHAFCDDLLDYWPDVQHPVGYHPTSACTQEETHTRGFAAWMSRADDGTPLVDPVRMRNVSLASQVFGTAHLVCDAMAYAAPGHKLNPFYMTSKWNLQSTADPALPRPAPHVALDDMLFEGSASQDPTDTTFRPQGGEGDFAQHSVGLVRAWAAWDGANAAQAQEQLDASWPHWPEDATFGKLSGYFLSSAGSTPPAGCNFPLLHQCDDDIDCQSEAAELQCLKGAGSERGVCMQKDTCFEHSHCAPQGKLCSGEGRCADAVLRVRNEATVDAEVQLFAQVGCETSSKRYSMFDNVPDFATANGMCSFRNWFHFINTTASVRAAKSVIKVPDRLVHHTDRANPQLLSELGVLKTLPHACDRTYAHTDYNVCTGGGVVTTTESSAPADVLLASRTWLEQDGEWYARFCDMRPSREPSGFLNPYSPADGTLHSATRDVRRCSEFAMCPSVHFHVSGRTVDSRRVRVHESSDDSRYGVRALTATREYCGLDAQRCWGMGLLLGVDCEDVDKEKSDKCVVDDLVLPLVHIVYRRNELQQLAKLQELRQHCPRAFTLAFKGKKDLELFADAEYHLTRPYAWEDEALRWRVLQYANSLPWLVFGMTEEQESLQQGDGRGFTGVLAYAEHSQCAVFVAQQLLLNQQRFNTESFYSRSTAQVLEGDEVQPTPVVPGASLYVFVESVPVTISFRWFMQCVVLAKTQADGGVQARFLAQLNTGTVDYDFAQCDNYVLGAANHNVNGAQNPNVTLSLHQWLRTAPFLFTLMDSTDGANAGMNALQINKDISDTIAFAVDELQVTEVPDLFCVQAVDEWSVLATTSNIRHHSLHRFGTSDAESVNRRVGGFSSQLERAANASIHKQVLDFLTHKSQFVWDTDKQAVTVDDLLRAGVIRKTQHNMQMLVLPREVYPEYEYVQLSAANMEPLVQPRIYKDVDAYAVSSELCTCDGSAPSACKRLRVPEYNSTLVAACSRSQVLQCSDAVERLLDDRVQHKPPFLQQHELLYLVLLIIKNQIQNTVSGGFMALHRLRKPEHVQAISELYAHELPRSSLRLSFVQARQFNEFVRTRKALSWKCPAKSLEWQVQTNQMHVALRQCKLALQQMIGWKLPASAGGFTKTLLLKPQALSLLSGFYPSFMFRESTEEYNKFLDKLVDTQWEQAEFADFARAVCYDAGGEISVMAPFWAEHFDVATNVAGEDSASDPPLACDMQRSSSDSTILVYSTLCTTSPNSARVCAEHPEYEQHILHTLPAVCREKHGQPVVRGRLGALKRNLSPLCEQKPTMPSTCALKHGALHGHKGKAVANLDEQHVVATVQTGFWNAQNTIFRGVLTQSDSSSLPALALDSHDIGGHCLEFSISAEGWLYLHKAALSSDCLQTGGSVRTWLQNIEQDWSWEDSFARQLLHQQQADKVSWQCPLHWLQRFHDDNSKHQARSPSWLRNKARFAHITGSLSYAHPTVRNTHRLRGLRAARWMSDMMGCVAAHESECHSARYLDDALETLLADNSAWRAVSYVPADTEECLRVLDWPDDCGLAGGGDTEGECFMRQ